MSRPHRITTPWHPAWRSAPLLGTVREFWWLPAAVTGGQPMVCLRTLLAALMPGCAWKIRARNASWVSWMERV